MTTNETLCYCDDGSDTHGHPAHKRYEIQVTVIDPEWNDRFAQNYWATVTRLADGKRITLFNDSLRGLRRQFRTRRLDKAFSDAPTRERFRVVRGGPNAQPR